MIKSLSQKPEEIDFKDVMATPKHLTVALGGQGFFLNNIASALEDRLANPERETLFVVNGREQNAGIAARLMKLLSGVQGHASVIAHSFGQSWSGLLTDDKVALSFSKNPSRGMLVKSGDPTFDVYQHDAALAMQLAGNRTRPALSGRTLARPAI